ncbi:MAG TPA: hypothetical protein VFF76_09415 [Holophagaceae bacterium]|jgi:hypothetical protein|nr:hypothetical protein [Holophagaceae bacterium]
MKLRFLPLALAALALPALAQDRAVSLFFDKAPGVDGTLTQSGTDTHLKPGDFSGLGIKFGAAVAKWGPATLEFNASYRFKSKETLAITPASPGSDYQYEWGYVSAGADVNFTNVVDFGGGLDLRAQQSTLIVNSGSSGEKIGINHLSPWIRLHVGYTFNTVPVKPFVALEGAWDLSPNDNHYTVPTGGTVDINKAYGVGNPKSEWSLQVGIRF